MQEEIIVENGIKSILQKIFDYYYSYKRTCKTVALGELFTNLKLFPFMYRGRVSDANLAVDNGWYEIFGDISNAPFTQSWGPLLVIGNSYKVQFAFYSVSDGFKLYVRQLNHTNFGWAKIDLTQV